MWRAHMQYLTVVIHIHKEDKVKKPVTDFTLFFFQGVDQLLPFIESSLKTVSSGKVKLFLFFLILRILFWKGNKGENTLQYQGRQNQTYCEVGRKCKWRSMCDFSQGGVLLCIWEWSILAGKMCTELTRFFFWAFNVIAFLSPINADGAVKFLLF